MSSYTLEAGGCCNVAMQHKAEYAGKQHIHGARELSHECRELSPQARGVPEGELNGINEL